MKTLLVTTGNGMFGRALVESLAGRGDVHVRAMVRNVAAFDVDAANVSVVQADMDAPETLSDAVDGVTDVFLCSPMDEHVATREVNVVDAVVASGSGARILKLHGAVDHQGDHLDSLHQQSIARVKSSGLPWTLICPNSVMETSLLPLAGSIAYGAINGTSGEGKVGLVALRDVADATAGAVVTGGFIGERLVLTGPESLSMAQVAQAFTAVLGREVVYNNMTDEEYADFVLAFHVFPSREAVEMQVLCHYRAWARGGADLVSDGVERAVGRPAESLTEWIGEHREVFAVASS